MNCLEGNVERQHCISARAINDRLVWWFCVGRYKHESGHAFIVIRSIKFHFFQFPSFPIFRNRYNGVLQIKPVIFIIGFIHFE